MNLRTLIIASVFFSSVNCVSQLEKVQFELEKTTFKYSINAGIYKSRLPGANEIENSFKNFSENTFLNPWSNRTYVRNLYLT